MIVRVQPVSVWWVYKYSQCDGYTSTFCIYLMDVWIQSVSVWWVYEYSVWWVYEYSLCLFDGCTSTAWVCVMGVQVQPVSVWWMYKYSLCLCDGCTSTVCVCVMGVQVHPVSVWWVYKYILCDGCTSTVWCTSTLFIGHSVFQCETGTQWNTTVSGNSMKVAFS